MEIPVVAVVLGTYNRLALLRACLNAIRRSVGALSYRVIVVDGGSTDGTLQYLKDQPDVILIEQAELLGAVRAYNAGFGEAVELGCSWIAVLNDDDLLVGPEPEIERAVALLQADQEIGGVAFESDLRGAWQVERFRSQPTVTKGVIRRAAGMAAARAMGDPEGRQWWGHEHHTYAADQDHSLWMIRLGWQVVAGRGLRVHDGQVQDDLRARNARAYTTARLFRRQWEPPGAADYHGEDAARFGGLTR